MELEKAAKALLNAGGPYGAHGAELEACHAILAGTATPVQKKLVATVVAETTMNYGFDMDIIEVGSTQEALDYLAKS